MWNTKENKSNVDPIAKTKLIPFLWLPVLIQIEKLWYIAKNFVSWPKDFCKNVKDLKGDLWKGSIRICVLLLNHWCDWNLQDFAKIMLGIYREAWCQIVPIQGMYAFLLYIIKVGKFQKVFSIWPYPKKAPNCSEGIELVPKSWPSMFIVVLTSYNILVLCHVWGKGNWI